MKSLWCRLVKLLVKSLSPGAGGRWQNAQRNALAGPEAVARFQFLHGRGIHRGIAHRRRDNTKHCGNVHNAAFPLVLDQGPLVRQTIAVFLFLVIQLEDV